MTRPGEDAAPQDPDLALYGGGFFSDEDRRTLARLSSCAPQDLAGFTAVFEDPRLPELLFRYRARNYPQFLTEEERAAWEAFRFERLTGEDGPGLGLEAYNAEVGERLAEPSVSARDRRILLALQDWGDGLLA